MGVPNGGEGRPSRSSEELWPPTAPLLLRGVAGVVDVAIVLLSARGRERVGLVSWGEFWAQGRDPGAFEVASDGRTAGKFCVVMRTVQDDGARMDAVVASARYLFKSVQATSPRSAVAPDE